MGKPLFLYPNRPYLATAAVTATNGHAQDAPADILLPTEDTFVRPASTASPLVLDIDLGESRTLDAVAVAGQALDGVLLDLQGSDDAAHTAPTVCLTDHNLDAPVNAAWAPFASAAHRYWRATFDVFASNLSVAWVCLCARASLPLFETDPDADGVEADGKPITSPAGLYLGSTQQAAMRRLTLDPGQIQASEYTVLSAWTKQCIETRRPFVLVPDADLNPAYFGWIDPARFSAPQDAGSGLYQVAPMTFVTRASQ